MRSEERNSGAPSTLLLRTRRCEQNFYGYASVLSRKSAGIDLATLDRLAVVVALGSVRARRSAREPLHPPWPRSSSSQVAVLLLVIAPCQDGASAPSVLSRTSDSGHKLTAIGTSSEGIGDARCSSIALRRTLFESGRRERRPPPNDGGGRSLTRGWKRARYGLDSHLSVDRTFHCSTCSGSPIGTPRRQLKR